MSNTIAPLNAIVFPQDGPFRRDAAVSPDMRSDDYEQRYDYHTLAYDCLWLEKEQQLSLYCPKLLNFHNLVLQGQFRSDLGEHQLHKVIDHRRFSEIRLAARHKPQWLEFEVADFNTRATISEPESQTFRDLNCIITMSRDNDLVWLEDWVRFHIDKHGLQALILFDNDSSRYSCEDLVATLSGINGLQQFRVIPTPFRYGPMGRKKKHDSKFLQAAMRNLTRRRFFADAGAVLWLDIDELVVHEEGKSIFEETRNSLLGYREFDGRWAYMAPDEPDTPRHRHHVCVRDGKPEHGRGKYCIAPGGPMGRFDWGTHHLQAPSIIRRMAHSDNFYLLHCFSISTNWKYSRDSRPGNFVVDPLRDRLING